MSLLRNLFGPSEQRALNAADFGLAKDDLVYSASGKRVTQENAMEVAAVWACVRLLANSVSTLPVDAMLQQAEARHVLADPPPWLETPSPRDPSVTLVEHLAQVVLSLLLDGNSFTAALPNVFAPTELAVLNPRAVKIRRDTGTNAPIYDLLDERGRAVSSLGPEQVVHIPLFRRAGDLRGMSPPEMFAQGLGMALAAEEFAARFFGYGATLSGVIEYPEGMQPDEKQVDELRKSFNKKHQGLRRSHAIGILTGGAKFTPNSVKPNESMFLEAQKWMVEQSARVYGIPPHMIQSQEPGAVAFASVEHRSIEYVRDGVRPLTVRIETAYSRLLPPRQFLRFKLDGLLRGESKARWESYKSGMEIGVLTPNKVAALEDMDPFGPEGDQHFVPLNWAPLDQIREISLPKDPPGPRPAAEAPASQETAE